MAPSKLPVVRLSPEYLRSTQVMLRISLAFFLFITIGTLILPETRPMSTFWALWVVFAAAALFTSRHDRSYRLRLLADGARRTQYNRTINWRGPHIVRPQSLTTSRLITLKSPDIRQRLTLNLNHFNKPDRIALIEHCSLFLTPEQQAQHGKQWARLHARLLAPPKPFNVHKALWDAHVVWLISIVAIIIFLQATDFTFPAGSTVWTPPIIGFATAAIIGALVVLDGLVALAWFSNRPARA
jgi:uncharacterized integral membrane protein